MLMSNSGNFGWCVKWNWDHFSFVRPEYSGPALKVVHFDRSGYLGRSDRNVRFHLTKIVVPSTALLYPAYTNARWLVSGLCNQNVPVHRHVEFPKFLTGIC